jgi:hypothetical protein
MTIRKLLIVLLFTTPCLAADAPKVPVLTDAQKYEARTLQLRFVTAQIAIQEATANIEKAKAAFRALSDQACGKDATLTIKNGDDEPVCAANAPAK